MDICYITIVQLSIIKVISPDAKKLTISFISGIMFPVEIPVNPFQS